ncbi:hypothetical protein AWC24_07090 [Mycolicibacter senuensis]|uniref:Integral membrane protein n=1 Tax=Mycolicibacter senuensis TaxID=386913 RepID=A0A7I9XKE1_9MYCO|nr:hypothetical protein [Mycolicibacter senuensis]MDQ2628317.1 hypothetical protein [Actinomycetota bacterium]ORW68594.1 hypothetical protein AWC24_07090 [Mycolicibacter senuensis]GFG69837.1 hypothetical protein MSEN_15570 [Mycolicibacter senuensis]
MLEWFRDDIIERGRLPLLSCLLAFLVTFLVTRSVVRYIRSNTDRVGAPRWWQPRNVHIGSKHIHHVVFGVLLVMVAGVTLVAAGPHGHEPAFSLAAIAFGIGAALVLDEYALILHLSDVYWEEDGRASVDAVFAATAVAGLLVLGFHPLAFLLSLWHDTSSPLIRAGVFAGLVTSLPLGVVVLLKGKVWTGLIGMFFFPLLVVGAIRLSRPHAPWARWRYLPRRERMRRALERERRLRRPVIQAKLWLQDAIAGRPQLPDERVVAAELDRDVRAASAPTQPIMIGRPRVPTGRTGSERPAYPGRSAPAGRSAPNRAVADASAATVPFSTPSPAHPLQRPGGPGR